MSRSNLAETFAPIVVVQEYEHDDELALYFEHPCYARNAMYLSVYGARAYASRLIDRPINGKVLHDEGSMLLNRHLHEPGVERGDVAICRPGRGRIQSEHRRPGILQADTAGAFVVRLRQRRENGSTSFPIADIRVGAARALALPTDSSLDRITVHRWRTICTMPTDEP